MATKYIVNNVSGQTINGNLTINGNVIVTGTTTNNGTGIYRALLTQTGSKVATSIIDYNFALIIGETYTITNYQNNDDFSNVANVVSGNINETGCIFIATGKTPNNWFNFSELTSDGGLIVDILENTLGYDIDWQWAPFGGYGYYLGFNGTTGPLINSFPRNSVEIFSVQTYPLNWPYFPYLAINSNTGSFNEVDDLIGINVFDLDLGDQTDNALYYTPVEIKIKQDTDTTPINVYGSNIASIPGGVNLSINMYAGSNNVGVFYGNYVEVNDINELVIALNSDPYINFLGTFSVDEGVENGIILTMATNLKNQLSPNNTLTFEVFND